MTQQLPPMDAVDVLFTPQSIAVVGASADPNKTGGRPIAYLQKHGYAGRIYPINPKVDEISGLKSYASVADLPEAPDVAIILLGAERAHRAVADLSARGTRLAIVFASGFGEAGAAGEVLQKQLIAAAGDMRILGPNTIGAIDVAAGLVLSASGAAEAENLPVGGLSVASQSGGILGSLLSRGTARGIGFNRLASTGNEVDVDIADLIAGYARDDKTTVIAAYIEGIRDVAKFRASAEAARAAGKPLVVYKVGRSESGARAAVSHTGAMAGEDRVYDALFAQVGAIRADTFADLLDIPAMLAAGRQMRGRRVAVLTSTGGAGSLVADNCGIQGLEVPILDNATAEALARILGVDEPMSANPVDVTLAGVKPEIMSAATQALLSSDMVDGVVVVIGSSALAQPEIAMGAIQAGAEKSGKPLLAYVGPDAPHILHDLNRIGIPAYAAPESCAVVLRAALNIGTAVAPTVPTSAIPVPQNLPSGTLNEAEARDLFDAFCLSGAAQIVVKDAATAVEAAQQLGGSVVLKVLSHSIAHKSDVGGVRVGLTAATIGAELDIMAQRLADQGLGDIEGYLVQKMLSGGVEMILGLRRDPQLGPLILLGAGGTMAEISEDSSIRLLPLRQGDAANMIAELRISKLLHGYRGEQPYDVPALVTAIENLAAMANVLGDRLSEAEINPLFVMPKGQGVAAADGLAVLE